MTGNYNSQLTHY